MAIEMKKRKKGLGNRGLVALSIARHIQSKEFEEADRETERQKLKTIISKTVFAFLEKNGEHVTQFISEQQRRLLESSRNKISIVLGGQTSDSPVSTENVFLQKVKMELISQEHSNQNRKIWAHLIKIFEKAFPGYLVKNNLEDPQADIREILIEKI